MSPAIDIQTLRKQLAEKFPDAHRAPSTPSQVLDLSTITLPAGTITEIVTQEPATGVNLLTAGLITEKIGETHHLPLALIDAKNTFDPISHSPEHLKKLLWVRCSEILQAIKATDLLIRDGNLPLIILDLLTTTPENIRSIPTSSWHRLKQTARTTNTALLTISPLQTIPTPRKRIHLKTTLNITHLDHLQQNLNLNAHHPQSIPKRHTS